MMYNNVFDFRQKIVITAGGYGGLGMEASRAYAQCGATVIIAGRSKEKAEALARELEATGSSAEGVECDCTNEEAIANMVKYVIGKYGRIDIMVNFIGGNIRQDADKYELSNWSKVMELNLTSSMLLCKEVGKEMIGQRHGKIVLMGSVRSELGYPSEYVAYCAAKGAVKMYAKCLAAEWAKYSININVVAPTFVETDQVADLLSNESVRNNLLSRIPLGRFAKETDVAATVLFFSSPAADFITGQLLLVDGGLTSTQ